MKMPRDSARQIAGRSLCCLRLRNVLE